MGLLMFNVDGTSYCVEHARAQHQCATGPDTAFYQKHEIIFLQNPDNTGLVSLLVIYVLLVFGMAKREQMYEETVNRLNTTVKMVQMVLRLPEMVEIAKRWLNNICLPESESFLISFEKCLYYEAVRCTDNAVEKSPYCKTHQHVLRPQNMFLECMVPPEKRRRVETELPVATNNNSRVGNKVTHARPTQAAFGMFYQPLCNHIVTFTTLPRRPNVTSPPSKCSLTVPYCPLCLNL